MPFRSTFVPASLGRRLPRAVLALAILGASGIGARAESFSDNQKAEIGSIVRSYLMQNPTVLRDVMGELERRDKVEETAKRETALKANASSLYDAPASEVVGNPKGKVTLVEFFDYNCGYCKRALDDMAKLLKTEPELKVVLKDFPVLGPGSIEAAQVAVGVRNQLKGDAFWAFHYKLLSTRGQVGRAQALSAAKESGVDLELLAKDMAKAENQDGIKANMEMADSLGLTGTPTYVIGSEVVVGAVGYDQLKGRVANILRCGKAVCS